MKNNLTNVKSDNINKIDWKLLQNEMKNKFGSEIYDSWLKKIQSEIYTIVNFIFFLKYKITYCIRFI